MVKKYMDSAGVSSWTDPNKTGGPVLASGAFQITAWKHNQQVDVVRNDNYWNAKAIRQKYVSVKIVPDLTRSALAFENDDIDIQPIPAAGVARFQNDPKLKAQTFPFANPFIIDATSVASFTAAFDGLQDSAARIVESARTAMGNLQPAIGEWFPRSPTSPPSFRRSRRCGARTNPCRRAASVSPVTSGPAGGSARPR